MIADLAVPAGIGGVFHAQQGHPPLPASDDDEKGPKSPWYSLHTGSLSQKVLDVNPLQGGHFSLKIYPSGMILERVDKLKVNPDLSTERGKIEGFSHAAARRLREAFFTLHIPGFNMWAVTLTTHQILSPKEWREVMKRFRTGVKFLGWAGLWRVELQRRKAPHAHVAMYLPRGVRLDEVADLWLQSTREQDDAAAREHAVQGRQIPANEAGWAVYMGLHDGKHKAEQLGWLGKQWGMWNREAFIERTPEAHDLDHREHFILLRTVAKMERSRLSVELRLAEESQRAMLATLGPCGLHFVAGPRPKLPRVHRGNLLRCIKGEVISRLARAIKSQAIG